MKTAIKSGWQRAAAVIAASAMTLYLATVGAAFAQAQGQLYGAEEEGYARLILSFPSRDDLPEYAMRVENGVLSIEFEEPVSLVLPDVAAAVPNYLTVARVDPDGLGLRIGLRSAVKFNRIEAAERLFIDLMPPEWEGMPPPLPQDVIDQLAERARLAAIEADRERRASMAAELDPKVNMRVGRNASFIRLQFDWTVPTLADYSKEESRGVLKFEWPIKIDVRDLIADLPKEVISVENEVTRDGSTIYFEFARAVEPRFYEVSPSEYVLDIDIKGQSLPELSVEELAASAEAQTEAATQGREPQTSALQTAAAESITPFINVLGNTVRVVFPFEQDTPAAVFRRGDSVWMIFDTVSGIEKPTGSSDFEAVAKDFAVISSGDTQVVRIDLATDRLATMGSEGMAWVLSLGDVMLSPTEPLTLSRRRNFEGMFEMVADVVRPARIHDFRDPLVGDMLKVVTAFPPARGLTRPLDFVDFSALRSVHGLVLKPKSSNLQVALDGQTAVISASSGLTVSALDTLRNSGTLSNSDGRSSFVDLGALEASAPVRFLQRRDELEKIASEAEGRNRDKARLDLANYYVANQFGPEALGVLNVLEAEMRSEDITRNLRVSQSIANILAGRPSSALGVLNAASFDQDLDALFWRTIARAEAQDFAGALADALEARGVAEDYPSWARNAFYLAGARSAIDAGQATTATRMLDEVKFADLSKHDMSLYTLLSGRINELTGHNQDALDAYGQVIATEVRPTRAEAVYRTLMLLDKEGRLDLDRAITTLGAETMLWRGDALEAEMQTLLARLYFRKASYRLGFEAVQAAVSSHPDSPQVNQLRDEAQAMFADLFLNGLADSLGPVEALGIYYDFRQMTPAGARGDEMVRNLARRLVRMDLLPQAADLLRYQLDNRLTGVARSQVAADLAVIYLADRRPNDALRVLNETRVPELPASLARQRRILEARALIDGGRDQLALDLIREMDGKDVKVLQIDVHWKAKRYSQAGEMMEALYAQSAGQPLDRQTRLELIKAAVGYVMANDTVGLSRIRAKFAEAMVNSPEWAMFDYVTGPIQTSSMEFKKVAAEVAAIDGLNAFLASYRETYAGEGALSPTSATGTSAGLASR